MFSKWWHGLLAVLLFINIMLTMIIFLMWAPALREREAAVERKLFKNSGVDQYGCTVAEIVVYNPDTGFHDRCVVPQMPEGPSVEDVIDGYDLEWRY